VSPRRQQQDHDPSWLYEFKGVMSRIDYATGVWQTRSATPPIGHGASLPTLIWQAAQEAASRQPESGKWFL
jgi:hypothetical protein